MKFWRLDSYDSTPAQTATPVGAIIRTHKRGNPSAWSTGSLATHFNAETAEWVSARWVECDDPTDPLSRVQAIEAAEDHADQVAFDAWRERGQ